MGSPAYSDQDSKELAYDLRQRYAKLVADHLEDIAYARKEKNYPLWFSSLEDLHTIVSHKIEEVKEKKSKKKKKKEEKEEDTYKSLREKFITLANKHQNSYCGEGKKDPKEVFALENSLRAIERYLYKEMDDAKMFGGKRDTEGF